MKLLIFQTYDDKNKQFINTTESVNKIYCSVNNYTYKFYNNLVNNCPNYRLNVIYILKELLTSLNYDWVLYLEPNICLNNSTIYPNLDNYIDSENVKNKLLITPNINTSISNQDIELNLNNLSTSSILFNMKNQYTTFFIDKILNFCQNMMPINPNIDMAFILQKALSRKDPSFAYIDYKFNNYFKISPPLHLPVEDKLISASNMQNQFQKNKSQLLQNTPNMSNTQNSPKKFVRPSGRLNKNKFLPKSRFVNPSRGGAPAPTPQTPQTPPTPPTPQIPPTPPTPPISPTPLINNIQIESSLFNLNENTLPVANKDKLINTLPLHLKNKYSKY